MEKKLFCHLLLISCGPLSSNITHKKGFVSLHNHNCLRELTEFKNLGQIMALPVSKYETLSEERVFVRNFHCAKKKDHHSLILYVFVLLACVKTYHHWSMDARGVHMEP